MRLLEELGWLKPERPAFGAWQIDVTTRCGLACRMCIRRGLPGWESADMSREDFSRLACWTLEGYLCRGGVRATADLPDDRRPSRP